MTVVVGFGPDTNTGAGVRLAAQLAISTSSELVLCCVVSNVFSSPAVRDFNDVDAEWRSAMQSMAEEALRKAKEALPEDFTATEVVRSGRSVPRVLHDEGKERGAHMLVVGSSDYGSLGRIALGSTSDRLVHGSEIDVALAPRGYDPGDDPVSRIVFAVAPTRKDAALAGSVSDLATSLNADVDVVTFAASGSSAVFSAFSDQGVMREWRDQVAQVQASVVEAVSARSVQATQAGVYTGERWAKAVGSYEWKEGDLLVVGSSEHGSLARVFLGSTATRIIRHSPVPVILLPRI